MKRRSDKDALNARSQRIDVDPYTVLARYYDEVMEHVNYRYWASYIAKLAKRHGVEGKRAIDFACGTGKLLYYLAKQGYSTVGIDGSADMIRKAKVSAPNGRYQMEWHVSDLRIAPETAPGDLGICVYDSLNYLLEPAQVQEFFRSARSLINPGGLLVFDLSTQINSLIHFDGQVIEEQIKGAAYRRITRYDPENHIQHNVFNIFPDDEPDVVYVEHHKQKIYEIETIKQLAVDSGFEPVAVYHEMTFRDGGEHSDRVHIAAEPR